jgi:uncharacterized protein YndB with AHSA1/START domain
MEQTTTAQNGIATTVKKTFSRETSVQIEINADTSVVWKLLTNAANFASWNSTVISINGNIVPKGKILLKSTLDAKRVFKLKIKEFVPEDRLVWGDAMGSRVYAIKKIKNGITLFNMTEKIGGPLFPLFAKMIPSFDESFEKFAADLKKEAETIMKTK